MDYLNENRNAESVDFLFLNYIYEDVIYDLCICLYCVFIHLLCVLGLTRNRATIIILVYHGFISTNIVLVGRAATILFFSVKESVFKLSYRTSSFESNLNSSVYTYYDVYIYAWNQYSIQFSFDLVSVIAVERMVAVLFPFKA